MVIDPGDDLGLPQHPRSQVDQPDAADNVELPQLHRLRPFPALIGLSWSFPFALHHQAMADQDPIDRRCRGHHHPGWRLLHQLQPDPRRPPPRMLSPHLRHHHSDLIAGLVGTGPWPMRAVRQPWQAFSQIPPQPGMHAHPGHPDRGRDLGYRRTTQDGSDRVQPLLNLRQDNQRHPGLPESRRPRTPPLRIS